MSTTTSTTPASEALAYYTEHSVFSDPGAAASLLDDVPATLDGIRDAVNHLVFHYRGDGDWAENGIAEERISEIDLRYAGRMLERIHELGPQSLTAERPKRERMIGCCRDFTLLYVAIARHKGIPARSRVGFASYFFKDYNVDHVVAEVWDAGAGRWKLVDAEIGTLHRDPTDDVELNALDLPRNRFIVGPQAWLACREGGDDPERYVVSPFLEIPDLRSWPYLLHNVVQDLAALNKHEMILWDDWGISAGWDSLTDDQRALVDEVSRAMTSPDTTLADLQAQYARDEFRVPEVVTSWTSAVAEPPIQVRLEGVAAAS